MDAFVDIDREVAAREALGRYYARCSKWVALKAWWQAQRTLGRAGTQAERVAAIHNIQGIRQSYGEILTRALADWERAQAYKAMLLVMQQDHRMKPYEPDQLWQAIVIEHGKLGH